MDTGRDIGIPCCKDIILLVHIFEKKNCFVHKNCTECVEDKKFIIFFCGVILLRLLCTSLLNFTFHTLLYTFYYTICCDKIRLTQGIVETTRVLALNLIYSLLAYLCAFEYILIVKIHFFHVIAHLKCTEVIKGDTFFWGVGGWKIAFKMYSKFIACSSV